MYHYQAARRIKKYIPNAKLIFILRNPIERAYSAYWFFLRDFSVNTNLKFSEIISNLNLQSWNFYIEDGFYYKYIKNFLSDFSRRQLFFIISEELRNNPLQVLRGCCQFLEVDTSYDFNIGNLQKITTYPRNPFLGRQMSKFWNFYKKKNDFFFSKQIRKIKKEVKKQFFSSSRRPLMRLEDRAYLQEVYREANKQLEDFLQKDLSFWK